MEKKEKNVSLCDRGLRADARRMSRTNPPAGEWGIARRQLTTLGSLRGSSRLQQTHLVNSARVPRRSSGTHHASPIRYCNAKQGTRAAAAPPPRGAAPHVRRRPRQLQTSTKYEYIDGRWTRWRQGSRDEQVLHEPIVLRYLSRVPMRHGAVADSPERFLIPTRTLTPVRVRVRPTPYGAPIDEAAHKETPSRWGKYQARSKPSRRPGFRHLRVPGFLDSVVFFSAP